jgi:hypothetical protein
MELLLELSEQWEINFLPGHIRRLEVYCTRRLGSQ